MTAVVFECDFDSETVNALKDLRMIRRGVLIQQIHEIDSTLKHLVEDGAITPDEVESYKDKVLADLNGKLDQLECRMDDPDTIYSDELEMYLDLLSNPNG